MFCKSFFYSGLLLSLLSWPAYANPLPAADADAAIVKDEPLKESYEEVSDLNVPLSNSALEKESVAEPLNFQHHDEDQMFPSTDFVLAKNLKFDVELLETQDMKKPSVEVEERFEGLGALKLNMDNFADENIETFNSNNGFYHDEVEAKALVEHESDRITLTIILVLVALLSIALYAALVIWRAHLELRYGMRELLISDDDDFYANSNNNSSNNIAGNNIASNTVNNAASQPFTWISHS